MIGCRAVFALLITVGAAGAQPALPADAGNSLKSAIRPNLTSKCRACHNEKLRSSGLALISRQSPLAGGNRGVVAKPGHPAESLLLQSIEQSGDLKMPPGPRAGR